jgi:hypothetical protein
MCFAADDVLSGHLADDLDRYEHLQQQHEAEGALKCPIRKSIP